MESIGEGLSRNTTICEKYPYVSQFAVIIRKILYFESLSIRFYAYGNPISIKSLNDEQLIKLRDNVRNDLSEKFEKNEMIGLQKEWFFGNVKDPKQFEFNDGDIDLIKEIVKHVATIVDEPRVNSNTAYFRNEKNAKQKKKINTSKLYETAIGFAYGFEHGQNENDLEIPTDFDTKELNEVLLNKVNIELEKYVRDEFEPKRELTIDMVKATDVNLDERTAKGSYFCCFCEDETDGTVKVFCKSIDSASWAMSNLNTHMKRHHSEEYALVKTNDKAPKKRRKNTQKVPNGQQKLKQIIIRQLTDQLKKLQISAGLDKTPSETDDDDILKVKGINEGSCLFKALCHQLNSKSDEIAAKELRSQVVEYIKRNPNQFKDVLEKRIERFNAKKRGKKISTNDFLAKKLIKGDTYGGSETVLALKEMCKINIITIDGNGSLVLPICFNQTFNRTLIICSNGDFYYQSVISIPPDVINQISDDVAAKFHPSIKT